MKQKNLMSIAMSVGGGGAVSGGTVCGSALVAGVSAAHASVWSMLASWPLIGSFAAGKAAAAGTAAAIAAAGSAAVVVPAILLGGGAAYVIYNTMK